ncbi:tRNA-dihydrouridine(16/17) synthase [NAD(P)(+)]-like protein, partial [Linnemannia elongata]
YLTICDEHDTKLAYIRGHLFKIFRPSLVIHTDLRTELGMATTREELWTITRKLKERLIQEAETSRMEGESFEGRVDDQGFPILPHWVAQPYFRQPMPDQSKKEAGQEGANETDTTATTSGSKRTADEAAQGEDGESATTTTPSGKVKKIKPKKTKVQANLCQSGQCLNTFSAKCVHQRCKGCCRLHQRETSVFDCEPHAIRSMMQEQQPKGASQETTVAVTVDVSASADAPTAAGEEKST